MSARKKEGVSAWENLLKGTSGNLLWKWGAEKIPAGEAINAKGLSGNKSYKDAQEF
ncbi:MAG: hypothetical protein ACI9UA_000271 [Pseudoalteromonas tetraodonis]